MAPSHGYLDGHHASHPNGVHHSASQRIDQVNEIDSMDEDVDRCHSPGSLISTASTIPMSIEHPPIRDGSFIVYFEPRDAHKSNVDGIFLYQGRQIGEEEACAILVDIMAPYGSGRNPEELLDRAMCVMLKAIARADKERAIEIEESNETTGYRTLSTVITAESVLEEPRNRVMEWWRAAVSEDELISHCAERMTAANVTLLADVTFRHSAPMLSWTMDLPSGWLGRELSS